MLTGAWDTAHETAGGLPWPAAFVQIGVLVKLKAFPTGCLYLVNREWFHSFRAGQSIPERQSFLLGFAGQRIVKAEKNIVHYQFLAVVIMISHCVLFRTFFGMINGILVHCPFERLVGIDRAGFSPQGQKLELAKLGLGIMGIGGQRKSVYASSCFISFPKAANDWTKTVSPSLERLELRWLRDRLLHLADRLAASVDEPKGDAARRLAAALGAAGLCFEGPEVRSDLMRVWRS